MLLSHLSITTTILLFLLKIITPTNGDPPQPHSIFLLAGQSNMAGRGGVHHGVWDRFVPPESQPSPDILRLDASDTWVEAHEPLHADIDVGEGKTCGVGSGMAFANGVRSLGGGRSRVGVIGLVPCAAGGTRMSEWVKGGELYGEMVRRAKVGVEGGGEIRGVLWYQGESDTVRFEDAKGYKGKLEKFVEDLRFDLRDPSLLFILVAIASGEGKFVDMVREAQHSINLPYVKCVDAKGLRLEPDNLHLTTMSQVRVGLMLARAFLRISHNHFAYHSTSISNSSTFLET